MKYAEIKHLQEPELRKRLSQAKQSLFEARMKHKMQRLSNTMDLRHFKRDIAQLETVLAKLPKKAPVKSAKKEEALVTKKPRFKTKAVLSKKSSDKKTSAVLESKKQQTKQGIKADKTGQENKVLDKQAESKKRIDQQVLSKTKKWFGFFKSRSSSPGGKPVSKKSFFRRKSG